MAAVVAGFADKQNGAAIMILPPLEQIGRVSDTCVGTVTRLVWVERLYGFWDCP
jgi:hypothetical protein